MYRSTEQRQDRRVRLAVIAGLVWVVIGAGVLSWVTAARAYPGHLIEQKTLTAKEHSQTWESEPVKGTVYVHVYQDGLQIEQRYISRCAASYPDRLGGISISLRVLGCQDQYSRFSFRYLSAFGRQRFLVRLTRDSEG